MLQGTTPRLRLLFVSTVAILVAVAACDGNTEILQPEGESGLAASAALDGNDGCTATGTGLSAVVVNQDVIGQTVIIGDCDVGAFFDQDGTVRNATFEQPDDDPDPSVQHLVRVQGANVDVTDSEFSAVDDYSDQILHIAYVDGATGDVAGNTLTGFKRAGILLRGAGTSATVKRNVVTGVGQKTTGWAENGIQVSSGATGTVVDNEVTDHWWDKNDFVSSGIILFGADDVTVQRNTLDGNDLSLALFGNANNALHNTVKATAPDGTRDGTRHYGALVSGENNGLRHNDFTTGTGADVGIYIYNGSINTKLIRNTFSGGFGDKIFDGGDETKLPKPFEP